MSHDIIAAIIGVYLSGLFGILILQTERQHKSSEKLRRHFGKKVEDLTKKNETLMGDVHHLCRVAGMNFVRGTNLSVNVRLIETRGKSVDVRSCAVNSSPRGHVDFIADVRAAPISEAKFGYRISLDALFGYNDGISPQSRAYVMDSIHEHFCREIAEHIIEHDVGPALRRAMDTAFT